MAKIKVTHSGGWDMADGDRVDYYDVGNWSMERIHSNDIEHDIVDVKHAIKAHKAWLKWLKKQK